ncbi:MAG: magnesium-dependent phosphatase-1 [Verrucomicrobiales bacterium]|nr:magnesium-dependent phosphatase-1 [Verrucomicrobiales bacterium]
MKSALSLIVFDLDFTLWDCGGMWVDCTDPPFRKTGDGKFLDRSNRFLKMYPDVPEILAEIKEMGCQTALASRTERPDWARQLLDLMGYRNCFDFEEIFPSSKVAHFANLKEKSGIPYDEMLFFDDEARNILEVGNLGVKCVEINRGIDREAFRNGLKWF